MSRLDSFPTTDLIQQYRNVFSAPDGPTVLSHMLYDLGFYLETPPGNHEDTILKNYAARLLTILGGGEVSISATKLYIKAVIAQPLKKTGVEEDGGE